MINKKFRTSIFSQSSDAPALLRDISSRWLLRNHCRLSIFLRFLKTVTQRKARNHSKTFAAYRLGCCFHHIRSLCLLLERTSLPRQGLESCQCTFLLTKSLYFQMHNDYCILENICPLCSPIRYHPSAQSRSDSHRAYPDLSTPTSQAFRALFTTSPPNHSLRSATSTSGHSTDAKCPPASCSL